jgi:hypothetical protein
MASETQPSTGERAVAKPREEIVREAQRLEETLLHSSKGHFEAERLWSRFHWSLGIPLVLLSATASASLLGKLGDTGLIASLLSLGVLLLSALSTFVNAQERVTAHHSAGSNYDALMSTVRIFRTIECSTEIDDGILSDRLKTYTEQKNRLNDNCPGIPRFAYRRAKKAIEDGEGTYAIDKAKAQEEPTNKGAG